MKIILFPNCPLLTYNINDGNMCSKTHKECISQSYNKCAFISKQEVIDIAQLEINYKRDKNEKN